MTAPLVRFDDRAWETVREAWEWLGVAAPNVVRIEARNQNGRLAAGISIDVELWNDGGDTY